jgi:hypothetical protein
MSSTGFGMYGLNYRTSAQPDNASKLTAKLFETANKKPEFILNRTHCQFAPHGEVSDKVLKDLQVIFDSKKINSKKRWTIV